MAGPLPLPSPLADPTAAAPDRLGELLKRRHFVVRYSAAGEGCGRRHASGCPRRLLCRRSWLALAVGVHVDVPVDVLHNYALLNALRPQLG